MQLRLVILLCFLWGLGNKLDRAGPRITETCLKSKRVEEQEIVAETGVVVVAVAAAASAL